MSNDSKEYPRIISGTPRGGLQHLSQAEWDRKIELLIYDLHQRMLVLERRINQFEELVLERRINQSEERRIHGA